MKETVREPEEGRPEKVYEGSTLNKMKIDRHQSSNWQNIADIPEEQFENYIQTQKEITTSGAVKIARKLKILKQREDFAEAGSKIKTDTPLICGDFYTSDIKLTGDNDAIKSYHIPKKYVLIRTPRVLSEKQKAVLGKMHKRYMLTIAQKVSGPVK